MTEDSARWTSFRPDSPPRLSEGPGRIVALVATEEARAGGWGAELALAVAKAWRAQHARLVLADLSFADPKLHEAIGVANEEGVADAVLYGASVRRVTRQESGLHFISAGTAVADPASLVESPRWRRLCEGFLEAEVTLVLFVMAGGGEVPGAIGHATDVVVLAGPGEVIPDEVASAGAVLRGVIGPEPEAVPDELEAVPEPEAAPVEDDTVAEAQGPEETLGAAAIAEEPESMPEPVEAQPDPMEFELEPEAVDELEPASVDELELLPSEPEPEPSVPDVEAPVPEAVEVPPPEELEPPSPTPATPALEEEALPDEAPEEPAAEPEHPPVPSADEILAEAGGPAAPSADEILAEAGEAPPPHTPEEVVARLDRDEARPGGRRNLIFLLLLLVVVAAAAAWYLGYLPLPLTGADGGSAGEPVATRPSTAAMPSGEGTGSAETSPQVGFSMQVAAYPERERAWARRDELAAAAPEPLWIVVPVDVDGVVYHRVLLGPASDVEGVRALASRAAEAVGGSAEGWLPRETPLAFVLGEMADRQTADRRVQALADMQVPAYVLAVSYADGSQRYRAYAGGYADAQEASYLRGLLEQRGLSSAALATRTGRPPE